VLVPIIFTLHDAQGPSKAISIFHHDWEGFSAIRFLGRLRSGESLDSHSARTLSTPAGARMTGAVQCCAVGNSYSPS
jgi:hypothetical protein